MQNTIELVISDLSRGGAGLARDSSGRVIFVPYTAPGDRVRVKIISEEKRYAQGELIEVLTASHIREKPLCPVFGRCGGCQWQHLPYSLQWETKLNGVKHALMRVKIEPPDTWDTFPAANPWNYRNRIQLRGQVDKLGFFAAKSHELIHVSQCEIARSEINQALPMIRQEGSKLSRPYKVEIEVMPDGEVRSFWNSSHASGGFRQVFDEQNEQLKKWVGSGLSNGRALLDLFGGSGNLSLPMTDNMNEIHCIDLAAPKSRSANQPPSINFHRSAVMPWLLRAAAIEEFRSKGPWSAIMDPPREGLGTEFGDIQSALRQIGVDELVMVGCNPDSWAMDLSKFIRKGWKLTKVAALDFFPQTPHIESMALLHL